MWQTRITRNPVPLAALILALAAAGCSSTPPGLSDGINGAFIRAAPTWDLNHDGDVTCEEWRQYAASVFRDADLNHDGKLTPEEFRNDPRFKPMLKFLPMVDADHDGALSKAEFLNALQLMRKMREQQRAAAATPKEDAGSAAMKQSASGSN